MWFLKNKTVRYGTETITCHGPKIRSITPDEIRESALLKIIRQKIKLWKSNYAAFAKNTLQMLASLIFHEFQ